MQQVPSDESSDFNHSAALGEPDKADADFETAEILFILTTNRTGALDAAIPLNRDD